MSIPILARARLARLPSCLRISRRSYTSAPSPASPVTSPFAPRHFLSIADLTTAELCTLVRNASAYKQAFKSGDPVPHLKNSLSAKTVALLFNKRSTRTRVSMESAITTLGGHPMFLGREDIQLGVNETAYDSAVVISSMVTAIVARVNEHAVVADLAKHSTVPVINALSDLYHPLQIIADYLTIVEAFPSSLGATSSQGLGLEGLKIAWVGDANNVLFDLAIGAMKLGINISVATPKAYAIPEHMRQIIKHAGDDAPTPGSMSETNIPEEAIKDADILVTDTWVSMGQEAEKIQRLKDFEGYQITADLAKRGGAKEGWRFMHCLPRHTEEVDDAVFYGPKSLVFPEAENRLWSAISVLEAFILNKGRVLPGDRQI